MAGKNYLVAAIVTVTVITIILAALVPMITDSSSMIKSKAENPDGNVTYSREADPTFSIKIESSAVYVNDYAISPITRQTILAACDDWAVFTFNTTNLYVLKDGSYDSVKASTTVEYSNGELKYTKGDSTDVTLTVSGDVLYANNVKPSYVGYTSNISGFTISIDPEAVIYFFGNANLTNSDLTPSSIGPILMGMGTYDDLEVNIESLQNTTITAELTNEPVSQKEHIDFLVQYSISATDSNGTYIGTPSYGTYVPIEYTTLTSSDDAARAIVAVIPLMLIVALLLAAVSIFIKNRE